MERSILKNKMQKKLYLLYALNLADWICTVALLHTGGFYEANPLMQPFIGSMLWGFLLKGAIPAVIILLILFILRLLETGELLQLDRFIAFALTFYTALCLGHIVNFVIWFLNLRT